VCGVVLVVSFVVVVLFLTCRVLCCSCCVFVCVTCFSSYTCTFPIHSFEYGSSGHSDTYANEPLASAPDFRVMRVEFWGFVHSDHVSPRVQAHAEQAAADDDDAGSVPEPIPTAARSFSYNPDWAQGMLSRARGAGR